jgi:hypothetical protein
MPENVRSMQICEPGQLQDVSQPPLLLPASGLPPPVPLVQVHDVGSQVSPEGQVTVLQLQLVTVHWCDVVLQVSLLGQQLLPQLPVGRQPQAHWPVVVLQ